MPTPKNSENGDALSKADETLFYHLLETELGGVEVYQTALECAVNDELREEWTKYLDETRRHVEVATKILEAVGLDPKFESPSRTPVRVIGESLVQAMKTVQEGGDPAAAQLAACEAVVLAETKDHLNWELLEECASRFKGEAGKLIQKALEDIEEQEDEHLYHTKGWARELWLEALGKPAVLPPPEEQKDVKSAIGAERARKGRKNMRKRRSAS